MFQTPDPDLDLLLLPASLTKYSDIPSLIEVSGRFCSLCGDVYVLKSKWKSIIGMSNVYVSICLRGQFYVGMSMWGSLSGRWRSLSGEVFMRKSVWGVYV